MPINFMKIGNPFFVFLVLALCSAASKAADIYNGGELYALHCALCHGQSGTSVMSSAPNFAQGESLMQPDPALLASIKNGKGAMPSFQGRLSDLEILDVVVFLRTLN